MLSGDTSPTAHVMRPFFCIPSLPLPLPALISLFSPDPRPSLGAERKAQEAWADLGFFFTAMEDEETTEEEAAALNWQ